LTDVNRFRDVRIESRATIRSRSWFITEAVTAMTGSAPKRPRSSSSTWKPVIPGSWMSSSAACGSNAGASLTARSPLSTARTA